MSGLLQEAINTPASKVGSKARSGPSRLVSRCKKAKHWTCASEKFPVDSMVCWMCSRQLSHPAMVRVQDVNPLRKAGVKCSKECFHPRESRIGCKKANTTKSLERSFWHGKWEKELEWRVKHLFQASFLPASPLFFIWTLEWVVFKEASLLMEVLWCRWSIFQLGSLYFVYWWDMQ